MRPAGGCRGWEGGMRVVMKLARGGTQRLGGGHERMVRAGTRLNPVFHALRHGSRNLHSRKGALGGDRAALREE